MVYDSIRIRRTRSIWFGTNFVDHCSCITSGRTPMVLPTICNSINLARSAGEKDRGSEATEADICLRTKKPFHGTVRAGLFYFIVRRIVYNSRVFAPLIARAVSY